MLNMKRNSDILEMLNYHRTRDMINLLKFFPELSPIKDLYIVKSIDDYYDNLEICKNITCLRNDTLVTKPAMKSVEVKGFPYDFENIFLKVKDIDKDGVLVLFNVTNEPSERYERYAGISVGVSLGNGVYIDAVGKGFDGREVTKGLSVHERYFIPWFELRKCNIDNFKDYRTYLITDEDYKLSRKERIEFLKSVGISETAFWGYIPEKYEEIPNFIWIDIIKNIIKKLEDKELELRSSGMLEFAISGHTEGKYFRPWQIFDKRRYILGSKNS